MEKHGIWGTLDPFVEQTGVMGRCVANTGFLRALLRSDPCAAYHFFLTDQHQTNALRAFLQNEFPHLLDGGRIYLGTRPDLPIALRTQRYHCFHLSDCINAPAHLARLRNFLAQDLFPITSITHSLSYARYAKDFLAHLWPGCTPRDAIMATSETARQMLADSFAYLRRAYGLDDSFAAPALHVVPLGIDLHAFTPLGDREERRGLREKRNIASSKIVLLVFARLTHTAKLDALALLRALKRAATPPLSLSDFTLVLAGAGDSREKSDYVNHLNVLAHNMGLQLLVQENPDEDAKRELFRCSDIFVSPVDNYQETFGITLLEAGAMELPVVASDFDGYRSLVRHGETGILVPTIGPAQTTYIDAQANLLMDNQHQLACAQQLAVDVPALARALRKLALSPGLRASMGRAARQHIVQHFSWDTIIWKMAGLWDDLWQQPLPQENVERLRIIPHPLHLPLNRAFASYPLKTLEPDMVLGWSKTGEAHYRGQEGLIVYGGLQSFIEPEQVKHLLFLARKDESVAELTRKFSRQLSITEEEAAWYVLWALKHDLLEFRQ